MKLQKIPFLHRRSLCKLFRAKEEMCKNNYNVKWIRKELKDLKIQTTKQ